MSTVPHDTSPEIDDYLRARLRALSGSERLQMATRMFTTAKTLAEARARALGVRDGPALKIAVLRHLYGNDLSEEQYEALRTRYESLAAQDE